MLIPNQKLNSLADVILETSVAEGYTDAEVLVVVTFLQDKLMRHDRPLRAIIGSIVNTAEAEERGRFLIDLIGICGDSTSVH